MPEVTMVELEEFVLLTIASFRHSADGMEIKGELERRCKKTLSVGSVKSSLRRSEEKGLLISRFGEPTHRQGGKRKRVYALTTRAWKVLEEMKETRAMLWEDIHHRMTRREKGGSPSPAAPSGVVAPKKTPSLNRRTKGVKQLNG